MHEKHKIAIVAVIDGDGNLLMIRRVKNGTDSNGGKWEFPAGHIDGGELPEIAAVREVFEETGLQVYLMPWSIDLPTKAGKAAQFLGFVANGDVKPEPDLANDEHDKYVWVKARHLSKIKPTHKNMGENLSKLLKRSKVGLNGEVSNRGASRRESAGGDRAWLISPQGKWIDCGDSHDNYTKQHPEQFGFKSGTGVDIVGALIDKGWVRAGIHPSVNTFFYQCLKTTQKILDDMQSFVMKNAGIKKVDIADESISTPEDHEMGEDHFLVSREEFIQMGKPSDLRRSKMVYWGGRQANQLLPTRLVKPIPEPTDDLREAILVGDEVEIFLKNQASGGDDDATPDVNGIVDRRNRNTIWIRPLDEDGEETNNLRNPLMWRNDGDWAFIRVYRDPDQVIHYVKGNPYDPDGKTMERAKGIGLILETNPPDRFESVFALMRNETPDLDRSVGQVPQSFDEVAPFHKPRPGIPPILHRVREVLRDSGLEPDLVDHVSNGRVLILTQDSDLKRDIVRVLQKGGVEVKAGRRGDLIATEGRRRHAQSGGTTTIPIETDDEMMRPTIMQKKRELQREREHGRKAQTGTNPVPANPTQNITPNPSITINTNPATQMQALEKYGTAKVLPGNQGIQMTFETNEDMKRFQNDIGQNPLVQYSKAASRQGKRQIAGRLIKCFRRAMRQGNYYPAGEFLTRLLGMGIKEESIVKSRLASRREWQELGHHSTGMGNLGVSRLSRRASRLAPDL